MKSKGFTLYELLITLAIISIALAVAIPGFNKQIRQSQTEVATLALLNAIETSRSIAVFQNTRTMLLATDKKWQKGWVLFIDNDSDGLLDNGETIVLEGRELKSVSITARAPMDAYVSFIGTGEGKVPGKAKTGAFLAGTIKICPEREGTGYSLVLSPGGRTRVAKLTTKDCADTRD
ncbi:MAG: fimT [Cellvibrio sp.]|nr:fimT [Cellvibrio sp.]